MKHVFYFGCLLSLLVGCQKSQLPIAKGMVIATGEVRLNDAPLEHGNIAFAKADSPSASDDSVSDDVLIAPVTSGRYEIEIAPGEYRVEIRQYTSSPAPAGSDGGGPRTQVIPEKYNRKSELTASVTPDGKNEVNFNLSK